MLGALLVGGILGATLFSSHTHTTKVIHETEVKNSGESHNEGMRIKMVIKEDPYKDFILKYRGMVFHSDLKEILDDLLFVKGVPYSSDGLYDLIRVLSTIYEERLEVKVFDDRDSSYCGQKFEVTFENHECYIYTIDGGDLL